MIGSRIIIHQEKLLIHKDEAMNKNISCFKIENNTNIAICIWVENDKQFVDTKKSIHGITNKLTEYSLKFGNMTFSSRNEMGF